MKRFFKKASLLLVALCLVVCSVLPSFAAERRVDGVVTIVENPTIIGVRCMTYAYYSGTYDTVNLWGISVCMTGECRGGPISTYTTQQFTNFISDVSGVYDRATITSSSEGSSFLSKTHAYNNREIFSTAQGYIEQKINNSYIATYLYRWLDGQEGWVEV